MKEYLYSLLTLAVISLLAELLLPPGRERLRRAAGFGLALATLLMVAAPLGKLSDLSLPTELPPSFADDFSDHWGETETVIAESIGEGIVRDLATRFALPGEEIRADVTLLYEEGEMKIASLSLRFTGSARYADLIGIRTYAKKTYEVFGEVSVYG